MSQILPILLPVIVPYVTNALKSLWGSVFGTEAPKWLGPFKAIVSGAIVAGAAKQFGVTIPSDLMQLNDDQVTAIITSSAVLGMGGVWLRDVVDGLKKHYGPDSLVGKILSTISGK
jgi:hypothetical protein